MREQSGRRLHVGRPYNRRELKSLNVEQKLQIELWSWGSIEID